jgi:hypothetical protein
MGCEATTGLQLVDRWTRWRAWQRNVHDLCLEVLPYRVTSTILKNKNGRDLLAGFDCDDADHVIQSSAAHNLEKQLTARHHDLRVARRVRVSK